jgi:hypothetical protein
VDGIHGKIYLASEYNQFKLVKGNRKIDTNLKLEQSIKKIGILRPIIVNSNMEILDGQHRYSIAKKYALPLPYYVSSSKNIDDIIDLNNSSKKWSIEDYINKYKQDGLSDYEQLDYLRTEYRNVVFGDMIYAAQGYCGTERERHSYTRSDFFRCELRNNV